MIRFPRGAGGGIVFWRETPGGEEELGEEGAPKLFENLARVTEKP